MTPSSSSSTFQSPTISFLHRNYEVSDRVRNVKNLLSSKKENAVDLETDTAEVLAEYEKNRAILSSNVQRLYEQNNHKMKRTLLKLEEEVGALYNSVAENRDLIQGLCSLISVGNYMSKYLEEYQIYQKFVDEAAKETEEFDSFSDIITKYNSLMSIFDKSTKKFNSQLHDLETSRMNISNKKNALISELKYSIEKLNETKKKLTEHKEILRSKEEFLQQLKRIGSDNCTNIVKTNLYKSSLLQQLIASKEVDDSIAKRSFSDQIDIIRANLQILKSIRDFNSEQHQFH